MCLETLNFTIYLAEKNTLILSILLPDNVILLTTKCIPPLMTERET